MLKETRKLQKHINSFPRTKSCFLMGYEHQGSEDIINQALQDMGSMPRWSLVQLDCEYLCWSPEHFAGNWLKSCRKVLNQEEISLSLPSGNKGKQAQGSVLENVFTSLEQHGKSTKRTVLVVIRNLHRLQVLFSYKGYREVFSQLLETIQDSSHLFLLMNGRRPFRHEKEFNHFLDQVQDALVSISPLTDTDLKEWSSKRETGLTRSERSLLLNMSGGQWGYIPHLESHVLWWREKQQKFNRDWEDHVRNLLKDTRSALFQYCQNRYFLSIERAKGYGSLRAVLSVLAHEGPLNLTATARFIGKSPSATKDYLDALLETGLIHRNNKHYSLYEPLLQQWIILREDAWARCMPEVRDHLVYPDPAGGVSVTQKKKKIVNDNTKKRSFRRQTAWKDDSFVEFD